jgi:hypothetical protein
MLDDRAATALALEESGIDPNRLQSVLKSVQAWIERLQSRNETVAALDALIERVKLSREGIRVSLKLPLPSIGTDVDAPKAHLSLTKFIQMQLRRRGIETRIVLEGDAAHHPLDLPLLRAVARARRWVDDLISGSVCSVGELARREGIDGRSVRRLIPLGFLSPRIIEAIATGRQPVELTVEALTRRIDLPLLWSAQRQALG